MDLNELQKRLDNMSAELQQSIEHDVPRIVGTEAVNHFQEGFLNEGFTDTTLVKWAEVKRRMADSKAKGADRDRKILTGRTGLLHDSIEFEAGKAKTVVFANPQNKDADENYAKVHQFGTTTAGRNRNVTIPARPFLQESAQLMSKINDKIVLRIKEIILTTLK